MPDGELCKITIINVILAYFQTFLQISTYNTFQRMKKWTFTRVLFPEARYAPSYVCIRHLKMWFAPKLINFCVSIYVSMLVHSSVYCACLVRVLCMSCACTVHVLHMYGACILYVLYMYCWLLHRTEWSNRELSL